MMRKALTLMLGLILIVSLAGCSKASSAKSSDNQNLSANTTNNTAKNITNQSSNNSVKGNNTETNTTKQTASNTTNSSNKNTSNQVNELFFGNWVITDVVAKGNVTIYSTEVINKLIGTKLSYSADKFTSDVKVFNNPKYVKTTVGKNDFSSTHSNVTFGAIGISADKVVDVTVTTSSNSIIDNIGSQLLILDDNTLVIYNGGVFFKAKKS